jgi:hypothetical protein
VSSLLEVLVWAADLDGVLDSPRPQRNILHSSLGWDNFISTKTNKKGGSGRRQGLLEQQATVIDSAQRRVFSGGMRDGRVERESSEH